jgi:DNA-binding beta-propeller fold protein YncE
MEDTSQLVAIDSKALKVEHTWPLSPGEGPSGLAMDPRSRRVFAVCDNRKMIVVDADTGKVVASPTIGNGPDATAFDPASKLVFSPNGEDGTLTLVREVSADKYEIVATIPTEKGARTMALDSKTHHVFMVTAQSAQPMAGATTIRRSYVPGSFDLLEYGG